MQNPDRPTIDPSEELKARKSRLNGPGETIIQRRQPLAPLINPRDMPVDANMQEPVGIPRAQVNRRMVDFERQQQAENNGVNNGINDENDDLFQEQQRGGKRSRRSRKSRRTRRTRRSRKSRRTRRYRR